MVVESTGKSYLATLPATVTGVAGNAPVPTIAGFMFNAGNPPSIDALPTTAAHGTFTFTNNFGGSTVVPYTVFGLSFPTYAGGGASLSSEQATPADEAFTGTGEAETVNVAGLSGSLTASSSNTSVVTTSAGSNTILVSSVGAGTATVTVTDTGNSASATFTVSVTTTTIPIASTQRRL
jgi:hypothetical protein